jgi:hypothetical protein
MTTTEVPQTRYTFALIVYIAPGNGFGRSYYSEGVHQWPEWCRTARGAWDFVKYAARELGPETLAVYRDGVKIGEYGRRGDKIMEWFGDSVGWGEPRDRRS